MFFVGGRKRIKDVKTPVNKKKRPAASALSSEDEAKTEAIVKTPKSSKKQKVIQEKETRKTQKVNHHRHSYSSSCSKSYTNLSSIDKSTRLCFDFLFQVFLANFQFVELLTIHMNEPSIYWLLIFLFITFMIRIPIVSNYFQ